MIAEFYVPERVGREVRPSPDGVSWQGYLVAEDSGGEVIAAAGGGLIEPRVGELFVLYADPLRRREGAGRELLAAVTAQQTAAGAEEQWVSVDPGNRKGIPFYEAMGFAARGRRPGYGSAGRESLRMWRAVRATHP
jgi:ribosomal protein S18 acetylase RimI-like enzyme